MIQMATLNNCRNTTTSCGQNVGNINKLLNLSKYLYPFSFKQHIATTSTYILIVQNLYFDSTFWLHLVRQIEQRTAFRKWLVQCSILHFR